MRGRITFKPWPAQALCRRCDKPFQYMQVTKARLFCAPCVGINRAEANAISNAEISAARARGERVRVE